MRLTRTQRRYLTEMLYRGTLQCGYGGLRSTLTVRLLEERGLALVKQPPNGPRWTAQLTEAGRAALGTN
jgi:hypothetical protein